jgi:hypothetical protein
MADRLAMLRAQREAEAERQEKLLTLRRQIASKPPRVVATPAARVVATAPQPADVVATPPPCPVCEARRKAKAAAQARFRQRRAAR